MIVRWHLRRLLSRRSLSGTVLQWVLQVYPKCTLWGRLTQLFCTQNRPAAMIIGCGFSPRTATPTPLGGSWLPSGRLRKPLKRACLPQCCTSLSSCHGTESDISPPFNNTRRYATNFMNLGHRCLLTTTKPSSSGNITKGYIWNFISRVITDTET